MDGAAPLLQVAAGLGAIGDEHHGAHLLFDLPEEDRKVVVDRLEVIKYQRHQQELAAIAAAAAVTTAGKVAGWECGDVGKRHGRRAR